MDTGTIDGIEVQVTAWKVGGEIRGTFVVDRKLGLQLAKQVHDKTKHEYIGPVTMDKKRYRVVLPVFVRNFTIGAGGNRPTYSGTFISASAPTEQTLIE